MAMTDKTICVVAALIRDDGGRVLLVRKRGTTAFMQPGGKRGAGESDVAALAREIDEALGDVPAAAREADRATQLCDAVAFAFCFEVPASATVAGIALDYDGAERITLDPWPLEVPRLHGVVGGFAADGYPQRLEPVVSLYALQPLYL